MKAVVLFFVLLIGICFADNELDPSICTTAGPICASCDVLAVCIAVGDAFMIQHLLSCEQGESCTLEGCTKEPVIGCFEPLEFKCNTKGMYPDPFDCQQYHYCVPDNGGIKKYTDVCDTGYGYNPTTMFCSDVLTGDVCPKELPVPLCLEWAQRGPLSNPSFYYICDAYSDSERTLYPHLFACPHGWVFNGQMCLPRLKVKQ